LNKRSGISQSSFDNSFSAFWTAFEIQKFAEYNYFFCRLAGCSSQSILESPTLLMIIGGKENFDAVKVIIFEDVNSSILRADLNQL
jgi:hypothetical protein